MDKQKWIYIDIALIFGLVFASFIVLAVKLIFIFPNWWTCFFPLLLLPLPISDYFEDRKLLFIEREGK